MGEWAIHVEMSQLDRNVRIFIHNGEHILRFDSEPTVVPIGDPGAHLEPTLVLPILVAEQLRASATRLLAPQLAERSKEHGVLVGQNEMLREFLRVEAARVDAVLALANYHRVT